METDTEPSKSHPSPPQAVDPVLARVGTYEDLTWILTRARVSMNIITSPLIALDVAVEDVDFPSPCPLQSTRAEATIPTVRLILFLLKQKVTDASQRARTKPASTYLSSIVTKRSFAHVQKHHENNMVPTFICY